MNYKTFIELNERSKKINKSKRMMYIRSVQKVNKKDCSEMLKYEVDEEGVEIMPEEVYVCVYDRCGLSTPFPFEMFLSTLLTKIILCEIWVVNPNVLNKVKFSEVEILPPYTLIEFVYDNDDDKSAILFVDSAIVGLFCLADLLGKTSEILLTETLVRMRSFGLITLPIEEKLKSVIQEGLEEVRRDNDGIVLRVNYE